ncbi:MAG TPA: CobW family GTP-binding protein [Opitutaceae bacterium]|nr:CobW family GTP-binding protein [Opitutaceae bacterium]
MPADSRIPVTVLTGFLGAGKTTLLNRILTEQHGRRIAVIENEFGEVGVDNQLVIQADEEIFSMNNGCLCCTVRGDLLRILSRLLKRRDRLDGVLIETTGLADPGPVAQTFFNDPEIRDAYRLDGIVTVVDACHLQQHLDDGRETQQQIAFADVILLNKTDLVAAADLDRLEARLHRMNTAARIHRTRNCDVAIDRVLDVGGFNLTRATDLDPRFLEPEYPFEWGGVYELAAGTYELSIGLPAEASGGSPAGDHGHDHGHDHGGDGRHFHDSDNELGVALLPLGLPAGVSFRDQSSAAQAAIAAATSAARDAAVEVFSDEARRVRPGESVAPGTTLQRLMLDAGHGDFPVTITVAGRHMLFTAHDVPTHLRAADQSLVRYVHDQTFRHEHNHDEEVASVGITLRGDLDAKRLNEWIGGLLAKKGQDIFRCKGVLAVRGSEKRLVFQGVHMMFDAKFDQAWGPAPRTNVFVFIGRNLDRAELVGGFQQCLAAG